MVTLVTSVTNPSQSSNALSVIDLNSIPNILTAKEIENSQPIFSINRGSHSAEAYGTMTLGYGIGSRNFNFKYIESNRLGKFYLSDSRQSGRFDESRLSFETQEAKTDLPRTIRALRNAITIQRKLHQAES